MKKFYLPLVVLSLFALGTLNAQEVVLKTPNLEVDPDATFSLDLQVEDFDMITGLQFSVNWDPQVLEFVNVDNFGLPGLTSDGNFGLMQVDQGILRFAWFHQELTGVTLPDMSTIFSVKFKVVGDPSSSTQVTITDEPIVVEVVSTSGMMPYNIQNGTVTVMGPNAANETISTDFVLYQNTPNPFTDVTHIRFDLNKSTETHLSIYDQTGRVVYTESGFYNAGSHAIPVERNLFQSAGTYVYTLQTANGTATRQLVVQ
ncbi:MAG: hypothetical protein Kow0027_10710 [Saprospiraceae bacterium]|nr:hypothetical protein [Saprospirales bacterium]